MSKTDNLHDFLTDIADAVRSKTGKTEPINAQNLSSEIRGIESGEITEVYTFAETMVSYGSGVASVKRIDVQEGVTTIGGWFAAGLPFLDSVSIPNGVTSIGVHAFQNCAALTEINLPDSITTISAYAFYSCSSLPYFACPPKVMSLGSATFYSCRMVAAFDFSRHEAIPTLSSATCFNATTGAIVVPDDLYDEWIVATNWTAYGPEGTNQIIKASEYESQNNE